MQRDKVVEEMLYSGSVQGASHLLHDARCSVHGASKVLGARCKETKIADEVLYLLPHLGWIAARAPNRVNRAHGPTKENRQNLGNFWIFPAYGKNGPGGPQMGRGRFSPA